MFSIYIIWRVPPTLRASLSPLPRVIPGGLPRLLIHPERLAAARIFVLRPSSTCGGDGARRWVVPRRLSRRLVRPVVATRTLRHRGDPLLRGVVSHH